MQKFTHSLSVVVTEAAAMAEPEPNTEPEREPETMLTFWEMATIHNALRLSCPLCLNIEHNLSNHAIGS